MSEAVININNKLEQNYPDKKEEMTTTRRHEELKTITKRTRHIDKLSSPNQNKQTTNLISARIQILLLKVNNISTGTYSVHF